MIFNVEHLIFGHIQKFRYPNTNHNEHPFQAEQKRGAWSIIAIIHTNHHNYLHSSYMIILYLVVEYGALLSYSNKWIHN